MILVRHFLNDPGLGPRRRPGGQARRAKRILLLEAGRFVYPIHVYNICRFPNSSLAKHFGRDTFWQSGGGRNSRRRHSYRKMLSPVGYESLHAAG